MDNIDKLINEEKERYGKLYLNTVYGKMVEEQLIYHDTDSVKVNADV